MPESVIEVTALSYFDLPRKHDRSTEGSEPVSPHSRPVRIRRRSPGPHLSANFRSQSDSTFLRWTTPVPIIEEGISTHNSTLTRTPRRSHRSLLGEGKDLANLETSHQSSTQSSIRTQELQGETAARHQISARSSPGATGKYSDQRRSQIRSVALAKRPWVGRSVSLQDASSSSWSTRHTHRSVEVAPPAPQPLRPPSIRTQPSIPRSEHRITIEKSFDDSPSRIPHSPLHKQSSQRKSSINPLHIFSAPIETIRRIARKGDGDFGRPEHPQEHPNLVRMNARDHLTNLKRHETAAGLQRVASVLQELKKLDTRRQAAVSSAIPQNSFGEVVLPLRTDFRRHPRSLKKLGSMDMSFREAGSQDSSLADYRIHPTPYNTPEEQATYTIINQDGEPEEFLKVDISIRGQTSYLPSEARRIHTPPLPSERSGDKRRGFFFNYDLPLEGQKEIYPVAEAQVPTEVDKPVSFTTAINSITRSPTRSLKALPRVGKNGCKLKTGDWYGTQLAELDSSSSSDDDGSPSKDPSTITSAFCPFLAEHLRLQDEAQLDHSIPEHLPNSPLCPRHPRYWRIVKKRGSQFRGC